MRAKRSRDTRLVDKFSKKRDDLAAESQMHRPVNPTTSTPTADEDDEFTHSSDEEEDNIKARNSHASVVLWFESKHFACI